jgi:hypothetical protein
MSESTNPHADLIAKLDDPDDLEMCAALDLARAYLDEPCLDCGFSGTIYVKEVPFPPTTLNLIHIAKPCPNPRHALIGEIRRVMGL